MSSFSRRARENLEAVRSSRPLIHNITNFVVMNFTANALLAAGASPVMAHAPNEVEDMASLAGALVLNIGTLTDTWVDSMVLAGKTAAKLKTPVILDPVGAGATALRTRSARRIIDETGVSIIRGNGSEILSLGRQSGRTKGVDSLHSVDEAASTAKKLALEMQTTLAITGRTDLVTDGRRVVAVEGGHEYLPLVTGTGCVATAVTGAFAAVESDMLTAAASALAFLAVAGEKAGITARGPGSFKVALIDALYALTPEELQAEATIVEG